MLDSTFRHLFKLEGAVTIGKYTLWYKSMNLWNEETDEIIHFKSLDDALLFEIDGKTIKDIVAEADMTLFQMILEGGSGNSSGATKEFGVGEGSGEMVIPDFDLPARMNTKIKIKTEQEAIKVFREMHKDSKVEHAVNIDLDGFASGYSHGSEGSVIPAPHKKGDMTIHNHPERRWGKLSHFSFADLKNTVMSSKRGIIATHDDGYYKFLKGGHFKGEQFIRDLKKARFKGKDYDDAFDKWLRKNQKTYGYKYTLHLDNKAKTPVPKIKFDASGQGSLF